MSAFLGIYKAVYDYQAQTEEELSLSENDTLYLLQTSEVDDWWTVKKRVVGANAEEPTGLVPSNYIEPATPVDTAVALYDYDKQTEEEISFSEGARFDVYDTEDGEWILVGESGGSSFGFVPGNYLEMGATAAAPSAPPVQPVQAAQPTSTYGSADKMSQFLPPPQRIDRAPSESVTMPEPQHAPEPASPSPAPSREETPPPMPTRPRGDSMRALGGSSRSRGNSVRSNGPDSFVKNDFFTWQVHEIEGRKKRKATLGIGNASIYLSRESDGSSNDWQITDLTHFSMEKKHVFLDLRHPTTSLELHAGSKDSAEAICSILGDLKGAASMKGLKEVEAASHPSESGSKTGKVLFDFEAASEDELTVREGDLVYILNDKKSSDWWMVANVDTEERGVVPAAYIEVTGTSTLQSLTNSFQRKFKSPRKKRESKRVEREEKESRRLQREERDRVRRHDERERKRREKKSEKGEKSEKGKPNPHRMRTWIDRSGSFKVEAEFLGCSDGKIHLHKENGVKIAVAALKLSTEDLEYVERVTGMSLEAYKAKAPEPPKETAREPPREQASEAIKEKPREQVKEAPSVPGYDWFEFFLSCGVDVNNCQRYTVNFEREQMDENVLEDITPSLLRTLGLREGDILRVMKFLDEKFNRSKHVEATKTGGLFSASDGSLKDNTSPRKTSPVSKEGLQSRFEDDAWTVKPAAKTTSQMEQGARPASAIQTPQLTGSLQDLVSIKPITKEAPKPVSAVPTGGLMPMPTGFVPITLVPTGYSSGFQNQLTGIQGQKTGKLQGQRTGFSAQTTGFQGQPTGPQTTFGFPSQQTGFQTSFGLPSQQTGMQQQPTGFVPQTSFGIQLQRTGGAPQSGFPPLQPQKTINAGMQSLSMNSMAIGLNSMYPAGNMTTGMNQMGMNSMPSGINNMATGMNNMGMTSMPPGVNNVGMNSMPTGMNNVGMNSMPTGMNNIGMNPMATGLNTMGGMNNQSGFGFMPNGSNSGMTTRLNSFSPPTNGTNTGMNGINGMNTEFPPQYNNFNTGFDSRYASNMNAEYPSNGFPPSTFNSNPQTSFNAFQPSTSFNQSAPVLQSQPTGFGFGNQSSGLQPQQTGKRANLANATPNNPFGF